VLNVRTSGSKESEIVSKLPFGTVVRVIEKSKGWIYVEFEGPGTDELDNGWVFSKYLRSFNRKMTP